MTTNDNTIVRFEVITKNSILDNYIELHANTDLSRHKPLLLLLENIHGIEKVYCFDKYKVEMVKGNMFTRNEIADSVARILNDYFDLQLPAKPAEPCKTNSARLQRSL
ncbi:MAG TPA: hypothetical protein VGB67_01610, partial [Fibrella sp.]